MTRRLRPPRMRRVCVFAGRRVSRRDFPPVFLFQAMSDGAVGTYAPARAARQTDTTNTRAKVFEPRAVKTGYFADPRHVDREMPRSCRVLFFDAAGTLIYLPRSVGEHYREVALPFGVATEARALDRAFRDAWKTTPEPDPTDGPRPDDNKGWWRALVGRVFNAVLTDDERRRFDLPAYFEQVYAHFAQTGVWAVYPDVSGALENLRADGYRLGVVSNFDRRLRTVLTDLGLTEFFEDIVISSEVGVDKPDPRIFRHALTRFGVAADEALHVGDDPHKDWGAETAGLQVFRLERPRHTLADVRTFLASD